jgi:hypothetical protein
LGVGSWGPGKRAKVKGKRAKTYIGIFLSEPLIKGVLDF